MHHRFERPLGTPRCSAPKARQRGNAAPPCFAAGTAIRTARGDVAVETLQIGDLITLHNGQSAPVVFIGHRVLDTARHPRPDEIFPVLIEAGAFAPGLPTRTLMVSPDHAFFLANRLIPARVLINGTTIRQIAVRHITYHHVELPFHAILFAEDVPAESYLPTGGRGGFANGGAPLALHPNFTQTRARPHACAPIATTGPLVERVRRSLLARAAITVTSDPAIQVHHRADGAVIIISRSAIPAHITHDPRDRRRLGVKIATLSTGGIAIPLDHPLLTEGWHRPEPDGRWTDGAAVVPAALVGQSPNIALTLGATLPYPLDRAAVQGIVRAR